MSLIDKLKKTSSSNLTSKLSKSSIISEKDEFFDTHIPLFNIALSGMHDGGVPTGITTFAAPPKHFKSLFGLHSVEAFMKKYKDGVVLFYDTEFGISKEYLKMFSGIDVERILHIPVTTVEELREELAKQTGELYREFKKTKEKTDHVMIFIDSIGNIASEKETEDAEEGKNKADMTRAKQIKSIFRIITSKVTILNIPMVVIAHTYQSMELFSKPIVSGGTGLQYASNNILTITKAQEKNNKKDHVGYKFTIVPLMSRFIKEKVKVPIYVYFESGIPKYSGLVDFAKSFGYIANCRVGRKGGFKFIFDDGEGNKEEYTTTNDKIHTDSDFWETIFEKTDFLEVIEDRFSLSNSDNDFVEEIN